MLYDLNIPWTPSTKTADLERTLAFSASLGYNVVALNHTINPPIPSSIENPLPKFNSDTSAATSTPTGPAAKSPRKPTVLHRATLTLTDVGQNYRLSSLAASYDIVALRPETEKAFSNACLNLSDASLISMDFTVRYPFHFRPKPCMAAVSRGLRFEVCYAQALQQSSSGPDAAQARANFVSNFASLVMATKGRGIVISSEARSALQLRGPADVVNLLAVWGLANEKGMAGLGTTARGVVVNEALKRSSFRNVVNVVEVGGKKQQQAEEEDEGAEGGEKPSKQKGGNGGQQKRKPDDGGDANQAQPQMSKRQAKKLRLAQRAAADEPS